MFELLHSVILFNIEWFKFKTNLVPTAAFLIANQIGQSVQPKNQNTFILIYFLGFSSIFFTRLSISLRTVSIEL